MFNRLKCITGQVFQQAAWLGAESLMVCAPMQSLEVHGLDANRESTPVCQEL